MIEHVIEAFNLNNKAKMRNTPANVILSRDEDKKKRIQKQNYHSIIGMMNNLAAITRSDILYTVHQCARFMLNQNKSHEEAMKRIEHYRKRIKDKCVIFTFNTAKEIEVFVDTDLAGT